MLIQLREGLRNSKILKFVFIGIITVPFALFGVGSYFTAAVDTDAATVNGEEISVQQFQNALLQQQDRMRQMFGGKVPNGLLENPQMREGALEQLVQQQLMVQRVRDQNYTVSDSELAKAIREREEFKVNGVFDQARYEQILTANRVSSQVFEESTRRDQGLVQLFNAVTSSAFILPLEAEFASDLKDQEREIVFAEFDVSGLSENIDINEDEIAAHYADNESSYMRPEQFRVDFIELDSQSLGELAEVDDEAIRAEYDSRIDEFATPEQRDASHILLELDEDADQELVDSVMARAADIKAQIEAGANFGDLAKEHSSDVGSAENGGSLGFFARGAMVEPFENAAFSLAVDEISDAVRSSFGVHIIKLNAIKESQAKPFEEVQDLLKSELVQQQVSSIFFEKQDVLATESFENSGSLDPAASALGIEVKQSDWISSESLQGIGQYPQVLAAIQSDEVLNGGLNSSVLEVGENHALVLRLSDSKPQELKPLEEVKEAIVSQLRRTKGQELAGTGADALLSAAEAGEAFAEAAAAQGVEVAEASWTKRENPEVDRLVLSEAFALARAAEGKTTWTRVSNSKGNPVVVGVKGVRAPSKTEEPELADVSAIQQQGNAAFQALQAGMREVAEVVINTKAIDPAAE